MSKTLNGPEGSISAVTMDFYNLLLWGMEQLKKNLCMFDYTGCPATWKAWKTWKTQGILFASGKTWKTWKTQGIFIVYPQFLFETREFQSFLEPWWII